MFSLNRSINVNKMLSLFSNCIKTNKWTKCGQQLGQRLGQQLGQRLGQQLLCLSNASNNSMINKLNDNKKQTIELYDYLDSDNEKALEMIRQSMKVLDEFITEREESDLMVEIEPYMKRLRYESSHWDDAIHSYRETERLNWTPNNQKIIDRIRQLAFPAGVAQIKSVHILDLAANGYIKPHIDSVRFCGDTIAGISLLSSSVMRLVDEKDKQMSVDILLKRRSLYIITGYARYQFTHEILPQECSQFKGNAIQRGRRISIICRNEPIDENVDHNR